MKEALRDRERDRFRDSNGLTKVAVEIENSSPITVSIASDDSKLAGESISAVKVVYLSSGQVLLADNATELKSSAYGITVTGSSSGGFVMIKNSGEFYDSSLSFTVGDPVFLSTTGSMTQVFPVSGYRVLLGYAIASNGININIQEKILI